MATSSILRPLDPGEAFFYMADKLSCMNFVVFAERDGFLPQEQVRAALDLIQMDNPLLRVRVLWNDTVGMCFAEGDAAAIPLNRSPNFSPARWICARILIRRRQRHNLDLTSALFPRPLLSMKTPIFGRLRAKSWHIPDASWSEAKDICSLVCTGWKNSPSGQID